MVLLVLAGYYLGGVETLLTVASRLRVLGASNPDFEQGKQLEQMADWHGAVVAFSKALEQEPDNWAIYNERANAELVLGDEAEGLNDLKASLALKPNADAYLIRALYLYSRKMDDWGEADANLALQLEPDNFQALTEHLFVYQKFGPEHDAEEIANYTHALELLPEASKSFSAMEANDINYSLYAGRAQRLLSQQRYQEAIADYNQIFEKAPERAYRLIMDVDKLQALAAQVAPDSAEYKALQALINRIKATGAQVR